MIVTPYLVLNTQLLSNTYLPLPPRVNNLVGLRIALLREMVFTLCLELILEWFFLRNPMVPADFWKKVLNMLPRVPQGLAGDLVKILLSAANSCYQEMYRHMKDKL